MMFPHSVRIAAVTIAVVLTHRSEAQEQPFTPQKPPVVNKTIDLTITPRSAPLPGFRYRLLPLESERHPGDAAPIYLRLIHETLNERLRQLGEKPAEWLQMPFETFPVAEARAFVNDWEFRLKQLEYGARRRSCDWNYTLPEEKDHAYEILLPDANQMRVWGRLLAIKARVEIAEGKYDQAVRTVETGLAFARHVAEGPFLINSLVGIAMATVMLERVDELLARPDAPNLYWALTSLPRPLIGIRRAFENEIKMLEWIIPELDGSDQPKTEAEWTVLLARFHGRLTSLWNRPPYFNSAVEKTVPLETDLPKFRASLLPQARAYLKGQGRSTDGTSDDQVLMLFFIGLHHEIRDEWSKPFYVSFDEAAPMRADVLKRYLAYKSGPIGIFVTLAPNVESCQAAEARLDRKVAALRAVEAIRMQAAADGGKLPESLAKVTVVPIPIDPATGKPFEYRREGDLVSLTSPLFFEGHLIYRLSLRK
jgi:hypothetical protein